MTLLNLYQPSVRGERATGSKLTTPVSNGIGGIELSSPVVNLAELSVHPTAGEKTPAPNAVLPLKGKTPVPIPPSGTLGQAG
ncbi:hypothetical protein HZB96_01105 [Candidatus Gottesmanbacteria bacterium]|nr:hypothetical protein [Candidatus Gottesmanbacteria bacterium]